MYLPSSPHNPTEYIVCSLNVTNILQVEFILTAVFYRVKHNYTYFFILLLLKF